MADQQSPFQFPSVPRGYLRAHMFSLTCPGRTTWVAAACPDFPHCCLFRCLQPRHWQQQGGRYICFCLTVQIGHFTDISAAAREGKADELSMATPTKIAIIPGNGSGDVERCNWYASVRDALTGCPGVRAVLQNMPDPELARESVWIPFMHDKLKCDADTVIVGHSSGAVAAMRYAERYPVKGLVLVSAYITDLGCDIERASGYFDRPWQWSKIKDNAGFVIQFGSTDDPLVPWKEQRLVAERLGTDLRKYDTKGHFLDCEFTEIVEVLQSII